MRTKAQSNGSKSLQSSQVGGHGNEDEDDFIRNGTYKCGLCVSKVNECHHTTAGYGPCMANRSFMNDGCKYRTFPTHYKIINKGTKEENVIQRTGSCLK